MLQEGQKVKARIELIRAEYVVVSCGGGAAVGAAATQAWNQRSLDPNARFRAGQQVSATIAALPSTATGVSDCPRFCCSLRLQVAQ